MAIRESVTKPPPSASDWLLPLETGDQLTRDEFERRYAAMPHVKKAELIEGTVYMPSPVRWYNHASPHGHLGTWLMVYKAHTPGVEVGEGPTIRLDPQNEPQPDAAMIIAPSHGGRVRISPDDYIEGAPDLLAEVAASTASIDLNKKFRAYERNEVQEYIVWRVYDQEIDWFVLREGRYDRLPPGPDGICRSEIFPGLWLEPAALVRFDLARVLQVLEQGTNSPEHARFAERLAQSAASGGP